MQDVWLNYILSLEGLSSDGGPDSSISAARLSAILEALQDEGGLASLGGITPDICPADA
jgi:hypothetical protein